MQHLDHFLFTSAEVPFGTPSFAAVITSATADVGLTFTRKRDIVSALRRVAAILEQSVEQVPADLALLRKLLKDVTPASIGMTAKTWSNLRSNALAAITAYGKTVRPKAPKIQLSVAWHGLWEQVLATKDPTICITLRTAVVFFDRSAISPSNVTLGAFENYKAYLEARSWKDSQQSFRAAVNAWNLAVRRFSFWPRQIFSLPSRSKTLKLPLSEFPNSFAEDVARFETHLRVIDPFDIFSPIKSLSENTIAQYRSMLIRFASILVLASVPKDSIEGLSCLVAPENFEKGIRWMLSRNDNKTSPYIGDMFGLLCNVAKNFVQVSAAAQKWMDDRKKHIVPRDDYRMTKKNRARLRPLKDQALYRRLVALPEKLFETASQKGNTLAGALLQKDALAIAFLLYCPMPRKNLFSLRLDQHFQFRDDLCETIFLDSDEEKTGQRGKFDVPTYVAKMLRHHLKTRSPKLCVHDSPFLFSRRDGTDSNCPTYIAERVKKRIKKELGIEMNVHLFRHLASTTILEKSPGNFESVREIVGHGNSSRVTYMYGDSDSTAASNLLAEIIQKKKQKP